MAKKPSPCPPPEALQRYVAKQSPPGENLEIFRHTLHCFKCKSQVETEERGASILTAATAVAAPAGSAFGTRPAPPSLTAPPAPAPAAAPAGPPVPTPQMPYRLVTKLGEGGMGQVWRGEDPHLRRPVAVKLMHAHLAADAVSRRRFQEEAVAAAALKHDHVVTIYQVGEYQAPGQPAVPYLAMEFLEGEALDDRLRRGRLPLAEVLRVGREIAAGLAAAHEKGLIHRDVKPGNVWLEARPAPSGTVAPPRVKLLDFGLVRKADGGERLTQAGFAVGTPAYMAPEQARCQPLDHRADLFSLGCVLYELVSGEVPFRGQDAMSTMIAVTTEAPRPLAEAAPGVPTPLANLIHWLLQKDPGQRPANAQQVVQLLTAMEQQGLGAGTLRPPAETPPTTPTAATTAAPFLPTPDLPRVYNPFPALILKGTIALLVVGGVLWFLAEWLRGVQAEAAKVKRPGASAPAPR